jgi:hypothetical protein
MHDLIKETTTEILSDKHHHHHRSPLRQTHQTPPRSLILLSDVCSPCMCGTLHLFCPFRELWCLILGK